MDIFRTVSAMVRKAFKSWGHVDVRSSLQESHVELMRKDDEYDTHTVGDEAQEEVCSSNVQWVSRGFKMSSKCLQIFDFQRCLAPENFIVDDDGPSTCDCRCNKVPRYHTPPVRTSTAHVNLSQYHHSPSAQAVTNL